MNVLVSSFDVFENMKFIKLFKNNLPISRVCFIASVFSLHEKNEQYAKILKSLFERQLELDIEIAIVDNRVTKDEASILVQRSDLVFLSGGDTFSQYQSLKEYGLISMIKAYSKIVMGMSAGALNMCENVILPIGLDRYVTRGLEYDGIGRVEFSILPHYNQFDRLFIDSLPKDILYGIDDDGFICCNKSEIILEKCHVI